MACNLVVMAPNLVAMPSNLRVLDSSLIALASNLIAIASNLRATLIQVSGDRNVGGIGLLEPCDQQLVSCHKHPGLANFF